MSVFVVDNELGNSVRELADIIDQIQGSNEFSSHVTPNVAMNGDITNKEAIVAKINEVANVDTLKKLNDREFEPTFNLLIYILVQLQGNIETVLSTSSLLQNLIQCHNSEASFKDKKSIKSTSILSELTLLFNLLPETSKFRFTLLQTIIQFVGDSQLDFKTIVHSFGGNLINWLKKSNVDRNQIKRTFWDFILLDKQLSEFSLNLIYEFTTEYDLSLGELHKLISIALNSKTVDLSFLINNNVIKALITNKTDPVVDFFIRYLNGELLSSSDYPLVESKSKILALCKFFETSNQIVFKYQEIPVDRSELEVIIINAIKNKLIEGKLDQLNGTFKLIRVNKFILPFDDSVTNNLDKVKQSLNIWRNSLVNVNRVVEDFRESTK